MKNSEIVFNLLSKEIKTLEEQTFGKSVKNVKPMVETRVYYFISILETYKKHNLLEQLISLIQLGKNLDEIAEYIISIYSLEEIDRNIVSLETKSDCITQELHIDYKFTDLDEVNQFLVTSINI